MSTLEMMKGVKETGSLQIEYGFNVDVKILDIRTVWGRVDVKVTPIKGSGEKWVSKESVFFG